MFPFMHSIIGHVMTNDKHLIDLSPVIAWPIQALAHWHVFDDGYLYLKTYSDFWPLPTMARLSCLDSL
jgi:hypothetical protein